MTDIDAKTINLIGWLGFAPESLSALAIRTALREVEREKAEEIRRLRDALVKIDRHLTNLQPHIAELGERAGFIDPHVDCALEAARAALQQKE